MLPGEYYLTKQEEEITTVLGSCVSVCIKDLNQCVGGMNHYIYPKLDEGVKSTGLPKSCFGNYAIQLLIDEYLAQGSKLENIEIKLFGGGAIISDQGRIGEENYIIC